MEVKSERRVPAEVGETVRLLISKSDPDKIYVKNYLLSKGVPIIYMIGGLLIIGLL